MPDFSLVTKGYIPHPKSTILTLKHDGIMLRIILGLLDHFLNNGFNGAPQDVQNLLGFFNQP